MARRRYRKADGSVQFDLAARRAAAGSAQRRDVDPGLVESLSARLHEDGYVVVPELVPREAMAAMKNEVLPFLRHQGRNELEDFRTRRIHSVIEKTLASNPLVEHPLE